MLARMICYVCEAEGNDGFLRWGDTTTGGDTHGLCPKHAREMLIQAGLEPSDFGFCLEEGEDVEVGEQHV